MVDKKVVQFPEPAGFTPMTGNPENGDYMDYIRFLQQEERRLGKKKLTPEEEAKLNSSAC